MEGVLALGFTIASASLLVVLAWTFATIDRMTTQTATSRPTRARIERLLDAARSYREAMNRAMLETGGQRYVVVLRARERLTARCFELRGATSNEGIHQALAQLQTSANGLFELVTDSRLGEQNAQLWDDLELAFVGACLQLQTLRPPRRSR